MLDYVGRARWRRESKGGLTRKSKEKTEDGEVLVMNKKATAVMRFMKRMLWRNSK